MSNKEAWWGTGEYLCSNIIILCDAHCWACPRGIPSSWGQATVWGSHTVPGGWEIGSTPSNATHWQHTQTCGPFGYVMMKTSTSFRPGCQAWTHTPEETDELFDTRLPWRGIWMNSSKTQSPCSEARSVLFLCLTVALAHLPFYADPAPQGGKSLCVISSEKLRFEWCRRGVLRSHGLLSRDSFAASSPIWPN